jgi:hypothetical protein
MSQPTFTRIYKENIKPVPPNVAISPATMDMSGTNAGMYPNQAGLERFSSVKSSPQPPEQHCEPIHPREQRAVFKEVYRFPFF